jgi:hypothetical protein
VEKNPIPLSPEIGIVIDSARHFASSGEFIKADELEPVVRALVRLAHSYRPLILDASRMHESDSSLTTEAKLYFGTFNFLTIAAGYRGDGDRFHDRMVGFVRDYFVHVLPTRDDYEQHLQLTKLEQNLDEWQGNSVETEIYQLFFIESRDAAEIARDLGLRIDFVTNKITSIKQSLFPAHVNVYESVHAIEIGKRVRQSNATAFLANEAMKKLMKHPWLDVTLETIPLLEIIDLIPSDVLLRAQMLLHLNPESITEQDREIYLKLRWLVEHPVETNILEEEIFYTSSRYGYDEHMVHSDVDEIISQLAASMEGELSVEELGLLVVAVNGVTVDEANLSTAAEFFGIAKTQLDAEVGLRLKMMLREVSGNNRNSNSLIRWLVEKRLIQNTKANGGMRDEVITNKGLAKHMRMLKSRLSYMAGRNVYKNEILWLLLSTENEPSLSQTDKITENELRNLIINGRVAELITSQIPKANQGRVFEIQEVKQHIGLNAFRQLITLKDKKISALVLPWVMNDGLDYATLKIEVIRLIQEKIAVFLDSPSLTFNSYLRNVINIELTRWVSENNYQSSSEPYWVREYHTLLPNMRRLLKDAYVKTLDSWDLAQSLGIDTQAAEVLIDQALPILASRLGWEKIVNITDDTRLAIESEVISPDDELEFLGLWYGLTLSTTGRIREYTQTEIAKLMGYGMDDKSMNRLRNLHDRLRKKYASELGVSQLTYREMRREVERRVARNKLKVGRGVAGGD